MTRLSLIFVRMAVNLTVAFANVVEVTPVENANAKNLTQVELIVVNRQTRLRLVVDVEIVNGKKIKILFENFQFLTFCYQAMYVSATNVQTRKRSSAENSASATTFRANATTRSSALVQIMENAIVDDASAKTVGKELPVSAAPTSKLAEHQMVIFVREMANVIVENAFAIRKQKKRESRIQESSATHVHRALDIAAMR